MKENFKFLSKKTLVGVLTTCFLLYFESSYAFAQDATLEKGSYTIRPIRVLEVKAEEPVVLDGDTVLAADSIYIDATIVTNGHQFQLDARSITLGPSGRIVAFNQAPKQPPTPAQAPKGPDGTPFPELPGSPHSIRDGKQGPPGNPGNPGIPGEQNPGPIFIVSIDFAGDLRVDARGQLGGKGGKGGQGGNGGNGVRGRDGSCSCGTTSASCTSPRVVPANNGGTSGNGGPGGQGGQAGQGGNAVPFVLASGRIESVLSSADLKLGPGTAGEPGEPGDPGKAGSVGGAGRPDGCCADIEFFGLLCENATGAGAGRATSHPNPGNLGFGDENQDGANVDVTKSPVSDFSYGAPLTTADGAAHGFGVSLDEITNTQPIVFRDLVAFNISRTFAYLLRRSISIAQVPSGSNDVVTQVIADLWQDQFVRPIQHSIDVGTASDPEQARYWVSQGNEVVQLFYNYENSVSKTALDAKFLEVSDQVDADARSLISSCVDYGAVLAQNTDKLLISHQISIPACSRVPELEGIELIVAPLQIREQLPPLPNAFSEFLLNEHEVQLASVGQRPSFVESFFQLFIGTANAQAITVEVIEEGAPIELIDPNEVRLGLKAELESPYVIESTRFSDEEPYSLRQLSIDLVILGSVAR